MRSGRIPVALVLAGSIPLHGQASSSAERPVSLDSVSATPIVSMGLPPRIHPYVGGFATYGNPGSSRQLGGAAVVGAYRDIGNAVIGLRALGAEAYLGGSEQLTGGLRFVAVSPALFIQAGANLDARSGSTSLIVSLSPPTKRGGLVGRGTQLRIDWLPSGPDAIHLGVTAPLGDGWGRRKPIQRTAVVLPSRAHDTGTDGTSVNGALRDAAAAARWTKSLKRDAAE